MTVVSEGSIGLLSVPVVSEGLLWSPTDSDPWIFHVFLVPDIVGLHALSLIMLERSWFCCSGGYLHHQYLHCF